MSTSSAWPLFLLLVKRSPSRGLAGTVLHRFRNDSWHS